MRKTILYVAWAPFFSGAERALLHTLRALRGTEYLPSLIAGSDGELAAHVRDLGVSCHVLPVEQLNLRRPLASGLQAARLVAAAARMRPQLVHTNEMPSYQSAGFVAKALGVPAVTHLRFPDSADAYRWFFRPRFSHAVFISESFKAEACAAAPDLFGGRCSVVYDAVGAPEIWPADRRKAVRRELGLPIDRPLVALTGQVAEVKGIWDFIAAADRLRDTAAGFVVLGDDLRTKGLLRRQMEAEVQRLGLQDRFSFLGFRPDAPTIVQLFDIVAVPSHVEPFGLASLEAMAAGRPVVATRVGGIPEVVDDGVTGLLVPPREPTALAQALLTLLGNEPLREQLGRNGQTRARACFSEDAHARALTTLYDGLLASKVSGT